MSLWLDPKKKPVRVAIGRFRWYPFFWYSVVEQYRDLVLPKFVWVEWAPIKNFLVQIDADDEYELERTEEYIDSVSVMISNGDDVPPVVVNGDELFDGRHRSHAARRIGIKKAPFFDISPFWKGA